MKFAQVSNEPGQVASVITRKHTEIFSWSNTRFHFLVSLSAKVDGRKILFCYRVEGLDADADADADAVIVAIY